MRFHFIALLAFATTSWALPAPQLIGDTDVAVDSPLPYPVGPEKNKFYAPGDPAFPQTEQMIRLGKALFWDEQLSSDGTMACGTCHSFAAGGAEGRGGALNPDALFGSPGMFPQTDEPRYIFDPSAMGDGKLVTHLNSLSVVNSGFFEFLFWAHRAGPGFGADEGNSPGDSGANPPIEGFETNAGLEAVAVMPPVSDIEMGHFGRNWADGSIVLDVGHSQILRLATPSTVPPDIQDLLGHSYEQKFAELFDEGITRTTMAMVLAHYMRSLVSDQAPLLLEEGLDDAQAEAFERMRESNCFNCHSNSGNPQFAGGGGFEDPFDGLMTRGSPEVALQQFVGSQFVPVTPFNEDTGMIHPESKIPSLLNLGIRERFFHTGHITSLEDLVDAFNGIVDVTTPHPEFTFDPPLTPAESDAMVSLWEVGFTDPRVRASTFPFDRPDLYSERIADMAQGPLIGNLPPNGNENHYGVGVPGSLGTPKLIASSPMFDGLPGLQVGVRGAKPGSQAWFLTSHVQASNFFWLIQYMSPFAANPHTKNGAVLVDGQGFATIYIPQINIDPAVIGTTLYGQWVLIESGPNQIATTDAAAFVLQ